MTQTQMEARSRTYSWSDPLATIAAAAGRSGLDLLRGISTRELPLPPIAHLVEMESFTVEEGRAVIEMTVREFHYNGFGTVHGGVLSTLLDTAAACAIQTTLPAGVGLTSQDLNVKFLRPATMASGTLRCEGTVITRGRRTALAEARLTDAAGRLVAHATSTCMLFEAPPSP